MIVSCRDRRTERFAEGRRVREFFGFARQAEIRLDRLEAAQSLSDLAVLPGNRLEALRGDRDGQYSIRINDQWRICFRWPSGSPGPVDVEIADYH
ncbi:MAG TPA: type II toxin-antitoxin system RelE/ParE family toxin [Stellaceae bacterium]|nr:type II toxin-antitoxin system RelE/ParE family toxin [Stellaceae bacterium]